MARIRTLKPEFWSDEKLAPLDPHTRLVFLGLICHADDAGRLIDSVRQLDGLLFPFTEDSTQHSLEILARLSRIVRYTSESGQALIQIVGWDKHQRVDRPAKNLLPPPPPQLLDAARHGESPQHPREDGASLPQHPRAPTLDLGPSTGDQDSDPSSLRSEESSSATTAVFEFLERTGVEWRLKDKSVAAWVREIESDKRYAGADLPHEIRKAADWHVGQRSKPKAPDMSLRTWLEKAARDARQRTRNGTGRGLDRPLQRLAAG